jgi:G:T/U-mismatch repair DNA glycosylase
MPCPNPCPNEVHQLIADWQCPEYACDSWIINDDYFGYLPKETHSLILGTFPVPLTKDADFFYHSDRSQFWMLLGKVAGVAFETIEDKLKWLDEKKIGITDIVRVAQRTDQNCSSASDKKLKVLQFKFLFYIWRLLREYLKIT